MGQVAQAQRQEVLAGESRDKPLHGTAKAPRMEEVDRAAGMMDPATRVVTPGTTTLTKMTGNNQPSLKAWLLTVCITLY